MGVCLHGSVEKRRGQSVGRWGLSSWFCREGEGTECRTVGVCLHGSVEKGRGQTVGRWGLSSWFCREGEGTECRTVGSVFVVL